MELPNVVDRIDIGVRESVAGLWDVDVDVDVALNGFPAHEGRGCIAAMAALLDFQEKARPEHSNTLSASTFELIQCEEFGEFVCE